MSKPAFELSKRRATTSNSGASTRSVHGSPLAELVNAHLKAKQMRQVDFCRETGFDQGLLSKILSSVVSTLNVESALKLAEGLDVPPSMIFEAIGKQHVEQMIRRFYCDSDKLM
ncbi:MAG: helix-turn-helix transcriptional regulator [Blastocatellia bacterium]